MKMPKAFEKASFNMRTRSCALQLKLEDEILAEVKRDEANSTDWLKKRITGPNDLSDLCVC